MPRWSNLLGMRSYAAAVDAHTSHLAASATAIPHQVGPASTLHEPNALNAVVWHDLTGGDYDFLDRASVMAIPAHARQRHILCGSIARCPLRVLQGAEEIPPPPSHWTIRTDGEVSPYHRMLWTVDDLIHGGWSLWEAERGSEGQLLHADRVNPSRWSLDEVGRVELDGELAQDGEVILIPGPHEGVLNFGARALRRVIDNLDAAANAARNPSAYLELHYTGDDTPSDTEVDKHIQRWADARKGLNGGVAWTNKVLELREHGTHESHLLIEGRNADAVDVSRLVSSPAAMADATSSGASLTYETTEGRNGQLVDYGVGLYLDAIAARLSMDDVVPRGQRVAFDLAELRTTQPSPTGPVTED